MMLGGGESVPLSNAGPATRFLDPMAQNHASNNNKQWFQDFLIFSVIDNPDEFDKKMHRAFQFIANTFEKYKPSTIITEHLNTHEDANFVSIGLIASVLKDTKQFNKYCQNILYFNNSKAISLHLQKIITEKWHKFTTKAKEVTLSLLKQLLSVQFLEIEFIFYTLFRSLSHVDKDQIYFIEKTLDILMECPLETPQINQLMSYALFRYLRFILEYACYLNDSNIRVKQKASKFCLQLLTTRLNDFLFMGRDLIRLIHCVTVTINTPEFAVFYKNLLTTPSIYSPKLPSLIPMLKIKTPKEYFRLLITYQIERKIKFFTTNVEFGTQTRPQSIFIRNHLSLPTSQHLRGDIIRYLCTSLRNESNKFLPRWAMIGWLSSPFQENHPAYLYIKLSIFFDFICTENITNDVDSWNEMEPALTVIYGSRDFPEVAVPLLSFFMKIQNIFGSPTELTEFNKRCFRNSLKELDRKFFDNNLVKGYFSQCIYSHLPVDAKHFFDEYIKFVTSSENIAIPAIQTIPLDEMKNEQSSDNTALFSDDDEDDEYPSPKKKIKKSNLSNGQNIQDMGDNSIMSSAKKVLTFENDPRLAKFNNGNGNIPRINGADLIKNMNNYPNNEEPMSFISGKATNSKEELQAFINKLSNDNMKSIFSTLINNKNSSTKCKDMEKLSKIIIKEGFQSSDLSGIVSLFLSIFEEDFCRRIFPNGQFENDDLKESLKYPIFSFFQELIRERNAENRNRTMDIFQEIEKYNTKIRYLLLYYHSVTNTISESEDNKQKNTSNMKLYEDYIAKCDLEISDALFDDLRCCINDDSSMFFFILSKIYKFFDDSIITNGPKLIEIIIKFGDESHVFDLITKIMRNEIKIIEDDELAELFELMITHNQTHQNLAWQIVRAHGFKTKTFISLLDKFDFTSNNNIFSYLLTLIANEIPTDDLLNSILILKHKPQREDFFVSIFVFWCENFPDQIATIILSFVKSRKNKQNQVFKLLKYFDKVVKILKKLKDAVLAALIDIVQSTPSLFKNECNHLLTLINDDQANKPQNVNQQNVDEKKDSLRAKKINSGSPKRVVNKKRAAAVAAAAAAAASAVSASTTDDSKAVKRKLEKDNE